MKPAAAVSLGLLALVVAATQDQPFFANRQEASGIRFRLENSPTPEKYLIETMTGGAAFLDYDGDGLIDVFLVNGAAILAEPGKAVRTDKSDPRFWNRLYRNLGGGRFQDVTVEAGVRGTGYGMGVAVGDYDNDGRADLFVTNYGRNELYHNEGNGRFREVAAAAGVAGGGFSTSAAFFDFDRDGLLDLYICRYLDWSLENNKDCRIGQVRDYCHPQHFRGISGLLYRNNGDGTFTDVSTQTGVANAIGKGLGVAIGDFNRDGWPDFYVANDSVPSFLFLNRDGKRFEEVGLPSATAVNHNGATFAGMGVDAADFDNDGWPDIFVTALSLEGFVLFRNSRDGAFDDISERTGLKKASFSLSGWGAKLFDYDNDGWKDLFVANSHVMSNIQQSIRTLSYAQPLLLLKNQQGRFIPAGDAINPLFQKQWAARGAAFGDFDNDGDVDILVQVLGGPPLLIENLRGNRGHWLGLELVGAQSNRDAIGASVKITDDAGHEQFFTVSRTGSYLSSSDPRIVAGLGDRTKADVEITWPSGKMQKIPNLPAGKYIRIEEDIGKTKP